MGIYEFFENMSSDVNHLNGQITKYDDESIEIELCGTHHDGTSYYNLVPVEDFNKDNLIDMFIDEYHVEDYYSLLHELTDMPKEKIDKMKDDKVVEKVKKELYNLDNQTIYEYYEYGW